MTARARSLHFAAFFLWGGMSSFALSTESGGVYQALAILPPLLFCVLLPSRGEFWTALRAKAFFLVCLGAAAACASALFNGFTDMGLLRYLALVPAYLVMAQSAGEPSRRMDALQAFALAGVVFCAAHAGEIDPGRILDPNFRIELFLNTTGVGFIAGMTLLTHAILLAAPGAGRPGPAMRFYHWFSMAGAGLILFLTRSRTAGMACLAGLAALAGARWLGKLPLKRTLWSAGSLALVLALWGGRLFSSLADYYSLFGKYRNISNATNRTEIWSYVWDEIIAKHPFLGVGPGLHGDLVERGIGFSSAHNGVLMYLAEIGVLGTLPYLIVFVAGLGRAMKNQTLRTMVFPLLVAGGVESMAETMFFSTGNVGSLLFLFALVVSTMEFGAAHHPLARL